MPVQENVSKYLKDFSDWLEMTESKLAKVEKKFKIEQQSGGNIPSKDILKMMSSLRKRIDHVTKFMTEHKDLADSFCHHAEKLADNLGRTLKEPRSLSPEIVSGLQSLQKTVVKAILSLTKSFKNVFSTHFSTKHDEPNATFVHDKRPKQAKGPKPHGHNLPHQKEQRRHSFTRTGKE